MAAKLTIGFFGSGKMATALAKGVISAGCSRRPRFVPAIHRQPPETPLPAKRAASASDRNLDVVQFARVLVLAVKPANVRRCWRKSVRPFLRAICSFR